MRVPGIAGLPGEPHARSVASRFRPRDSAQITGKQALNMSRSRTDRFSDTMIIRTRGKLLARALVVLFAAAVIAQFVHSALARDVIGVEAPDFALKGISGRNFRLSEYRSDVVALAFWASWCGECRDGLPVLERLQQSMGPDGLSVLSVSFDEKAADAKDMAAAARVTFPVLVDSDGELGRLYDVGDLPMVVLVDRQGKVRGVFEGGRSATEQVLAKDIRALLAE
jgi:peroxiredoxin